MKWQMKILLAILSLTAPVHAQASTVSTTFAFDGDAGGTTPAVDVQYEQVGDWVGVTVPAGVLAHATGSLDGVPSTVLKSTSALPVVPATVQSFAWQPAYLNDLPTGTIGYGEVGTDGKVSLWRTSAKAAFTPGPSEEDCGVGAAFTFWYHIGS